MLIKIKKGRKIEDLIFVLRNTKNNIWEIRYQKFFIFFEKNKSKNEKFKDLIVEFIK